MKTKEITLCGKTVNICYCLATEIAFNKFTGVSVEEFDAKNPEHSVHLILSGIMSWYEANGKQPEVTDHDIIFNADATEFVQALKDMFELRREWYAIPAGYSTENAATEEQAEEKNA